MMILRSILVVALLSGPIGSPATAAESEVPEVLAAARQVISAARFCTLITLDAGGHPQARVMDPFPPDEDFTIWMATNRSTRKVRQLEADPRVTLSCFDSEGIAYVTLLGVAELVDDESERERHFKPEWGDFYVDQQHGPDFVLIRLVPFRLEIVSIVHGIASDPMAWRPRIVDLPVEP